MPEILTDSRVFTQPRRIADIVAGRYPAQMENPIADAFAPLIGLPCWGVERGQGSILSFQFGSPTLYVREPRVSTSPSDKVRQLAARRIVKPRGEWNLFINCHWSVIASEKASADDESPQEEIETTAHLLDGQKLKAFALDATTRKTAFAFDLGATLTTWPYEADEDEQWSLYLPGGRVLTYRADGLFSLGADHEVLGQEVWQTAAAQSLSIP